MQSNAKITAIHTDAAMVITTHLLSTPFYFLLLLQAIPGAVKVLTVADIPPGGQNNYYTMYGESAMPELVRY